MLIYQGWFRPYSLPEYNNREIGNEILIQLNSYFLFIYVDFMPDPEVRFRMGWVNIFFIFIMVLYNSLSILIDQCMACRRKCRMRSNKRAYLKKIKQMKKQKGKHAK